MALLHRCVKINHFFSPKTFNLPHFLSYTFQSENPDSKSIPTAQYNKTQNFSASVDVSSDRGEIINGLTENFTKPPFFRKSEELKFFGERLTTDIVETVLRGLKSWKIAYEFFLWAGEQDGYKHNCYTYNAMATILSRARQTTKLKFLATDIVNSRCYMTAGALGFFIRCLGGLGMIEEANYIFDQMKKLGLCVLNSYSYNCLLEALAKGSQVELVEKRLKEMSDLGWNPDKFTLTPVLQAYCNGGKFEEALVVFNQIYDHGWMDEHVLTILVISFSKWGEIDKAFELIERMEDLNVILNEKTMCLLVHGFSKESRVDKALQVFDKMQRWGFSHDLPIYSVLIDGLCKKKEFGKALDLYGEMKKCGIFPDVNLLVKLISSLCAEGDLITANQLVEEGEEGLASEAQTLLYNAVLEGLVNHGLVEKAYLLLQSMMGVECDGEAVADNLFKVKKGILPNTASFSIVIDGLCKMEKLDSALGLFSDMARIGCKRSLLLYNNLINELCNSDRLEEGFELLSEMKEFGFEPTPFTHNCLFGCLCRRENVPGALELMRRMRSRGHEPWIKHSSMLVKQLCKHGKAVEACNFLNNMVQEGFLPDIIAYSAAIDGLFKIKEVDQAMELFRDISVRGYRPDLVAYNILIGGLCKVGKVSQAQEFLNEMLEKGLLPSVITYNLMIDGFCKMNEIDEALVFFKRMVDEAREPTVITYTTLIDGLCNAGRHDDALAIWDEMREKRCTPNRISYMALVHGLCKCNKTEVALVYFCEMEEKEMKPDAFVFVALISGFMSNGNLLMAFEILKKMVQQEAFPSHSDKNYPILLDVLCKLSEDPCTSSDVKNLIAGGCIPAICSVSEIWIVAELASNGLMTLTLAVQFSSATCKVLGLSVAEYHVMVIIVSSHDSAMSKGISYSAQAFQLCMNLLITAFLQKNFNEVDFEADPCFLLLLLGRLETFHASVSHWIETFPTEMSPLLLRLPQETIENGILFKDPEHVRRFYLC